MWVSSMTVPPQSTKFDPLLVTAACQGIECFTASSPPTILSKTTLLSPHPKVPVGNSIFFNYCRFLLECQVPTYLELGPKHKEQMLFQLIFYPWLVNDWSDSTITSRAFYRMSLFTTHVLTWLAVGHSNKHSSLVMSSWISSWKIIAGSYLLRFGLGVSGSFFENR